MSAALNNGKYGRVFDGRSFQDVNPPSTTTNKQQPQPVPPTTTSGPSKSTIFISIPQFRDGKRCAQTIQRLFATATHPERLTIGLIEQTDTEHPQEDPTCLEEYCALVGYKLMSTAQHETAGMARGEIQAEYDAVMKQCPRAEKQIRSVRFHHLAAKGPVYARSFVRKVLGNEEFCMQIDAATDFTQGWDTIAVQQWIKTGNEYAILSNEPLSSKEREKSGGESVEVPRHCSIKIGSEGVPLYENKADGKAIGLNQPLLSTTHSSSFSFAKCHYETNVPHDPFAVQLLETEKFPRYARLWTRGYDVYTPSVNLVYRDNAALHPLHHIAGHGDNGERKWPKPINDNQRRDAHVRMKVLLDIHHGITSAEAESLGGGHGIGGKISTARANLGIYGIGKRRTLDQLLEFTSVGLLGLPGNDIGHSGKGCANPSWVPYDASLSPRANLFDGMGKADDIDLDPEFPLRTLPDATGGQYDHPFPMGNAAWDEMTIAQNTGDDGSSTTSSDVPYSMVFLLWIIGLYVWYGMFVGNSSKVGKAVNRPSATNRNSSRKPKRKVPLAERSLKNV